MPEKYHYLNVLKTLGMFAVITLHVFCTPFTYWNNYYDESHRFLAFFMKNILISWAVPIFIMVSGVLFLNPNKEVSYEKIFKKYILRLILVLLTFGVFFALLENIFETRILSFRLLLNSVIDVFKGETWSHLWFIYMIIGLYICTPPLKAMVNNMNNKSIIIFIIILFVFLSILPFILKLTGFELGVYIPFARVYILYFLLGYVLHFGIIKFPNYLCYIFLGINFIYVVIGQFIPNNTVVSGATIKYLTNDSPLSVMMSIGIFTLVKNYSIQKENLFDTFFAPISLGVYIIHPLFINFILKFLKFNPSNCPVYIVNIGIYSTTLLGSIILVVLLRKIPILKKYVL